MKRFFYILAAIMLFSSCAMKEFATDTWVCSVELRSSGTGQTTTAGGGICLVKGGKQNFTNPTDAGAGGDELVIEVHSSHDDISVSSCRFDLLQGDQLSGAGLGRGAAVNISNGVGTITISPALMANNINESKLCTLRLTLRDALSGQEREFVKQFYVYKNFWLEIVPMTPNGEDSDSYVPYEGQGAAPIYGGEEFHYQIRSNQKEIYVKKVDFTANKDADQDNRLVPGGKVTLTKATAGQSGYYAKEFVIPAPQIEQDKPDEQFILTAFGEDYDTSLEETTSVLVHRYMKTTLEVFLSRSADPYEMDARNNLEKERPVFLHILTNRFSDVSGAGGQQGQPEGEGGTNPDETVETEEAGITCVYLNSVPNVTNPNPQAGQIHWFSELKSKDGENEIKNTSGQAIYPSTGETLLTQGNLPNGYDGPFNGSIEIHLHTNIPPKKWPFIINYSVSDKKDVGPSKLAFAEYRIFDKAGNQLSSVSAATASGLKINEGQYLAARLDKIDSRADGDIKAILENTTDGAVDFCFAKYDGTNWTPLAPKKKTDASDPELFAKPDLYFSNYTRAINGGTTISVKNATTDVAANESVWLLCRGLDRGGEASVKIQGDTQDRQGVYASAQVNMYVRHRAAIFIYGSFTNFIHPEPDAKFVRSENPQYGWYGLPDAINSRIFAYKSQSDFPSSVDSYATGVSGNVYLSDCPVSANLNVKSVITFSDFNDWRYYGQCKRTDSNHNEPQWGISCLMIRHYNAGNQFTKGYDVHPACYLPGGIYGGSERGSGGSYWLSRDGDEGYHVDPSPRYEFTEKTSTTSGTPWYNSRCILRYWCDLCYSYQFHYYGNYNGFEWSTERGKVFHMGYVSFQADKYGLSEQVPDDMELRYVIHSYRSKREIYNNSSLNSFSNPIGWRTDNAWWVDGTNDPIIQTLNEN